VVKLGHLTLPVADTVRSRDFYVRCFGLHVEQETSEAVTLRDDEGMRILLVKDPRRARFPYSALALQVDDVHARYVALLDLGIVFEKAPAELRDPDGYLVTMLEKG
jgi:catechol 2,3-dioxygenase-like lactoylglutathione lyase family enzyme